jgi:hypothetical protein
MYNKKSKSIQILNNKIVTNNTKCHFETHVMYLNISKKIKISPKKNNNKRVMCTQTHSIHKKERVNIHK